jgi:hypothetical protein
VLRLFRNNSPFTVLILLLFALVVKVQALLHPIRPVLVEGHFLFNYIVKALNVVFRGSSFAYTFLAILMLFAQSIYIKGIATKHKLFPRYTYIPAFVYLLLTSLYRPFNFFSETHLHIWLILGAVDYMFSFTQNNQPRKQIYNAGLLLCVATLFQFSLHAYFLLLLVGMVQFRPFNLGEWSVALMGYITPIYFVACILFLVDRFYLLGLWPQLGFAFSGSVVSPGYLIFTLSGIAILLGSGVFAMRQNVALSNIYVRRDWTVILFYLVISGFVSLMTDAAIATAWLTLIPALSIIISHAFLLEKNKRFSNFIFYFSLVFLGICLLINK